MCVCVDREGWGEQEQATHRQQQTERESILLQRLMTSDDIRDKFNRVPVVSHEKSEGGIRMANVFDEETDGTAEDREGRGLEPFLHLHSSHQQPAPFRREYLAHRIRIIYITSSRAALHIFRLFYVLRLFIESLEQHTAAEKSATTNTKTRQHEPLFLLLASFV